MHEYLTNLVSLLAAHPILTIGIVFIISLTEALFVIGIFVPSTVILVGAGALIGSGTLAFWPILLSATLGAVAGDALSYWIGHTYRERIRQIWPFSQYTSLIDHGQSFFSKHGAKSIFIARFLPAVKSIVPGIAGMMGMNARTFTIINVISAVAWSLAHILPGALAGRGLSRYWEANPRLVFLVIFAALALCIIWFAVKIGLIFLLPKIDRLRLWIIDLLAVKNNPFTHFSIRILKNEVGLFVSFVWATIIAGCLIAFSALLINVLFDPQLLAADEAISTFLQSLRSVTGDHLMVAITMLGDARVLAVGAGLLLLWMVIHQHWKIGASVFLAIGSATVFVPLMKSIVSRTRPIDLYSGAESFSFPSGHATLSATIIGVTVLVLVHNSSLKCKLVSYFLALSVITAIAFSRVYLGAHWPSDVIAGLSFGLAMVAALAFFLRGKPLELNTRVMAALLIVGYLGAYSVNYVTYSEKWLKAYAYVPKLKTLSQKDWLTEGAAKLPSARITFKGEKAEIFVTQTNLSPIELASTLEAKGWIIEKTTAVQRFTDMLLPSRSPLTERWTLPRYHDGKLPVLTATYPLETTSRKRYVIRFWNSGYALSTVGLNNKQTSKPILSGSVVEEYLEPIIFGWSELESDTSNSFAAIKSDTHIKIQPFINKLH